ncbi:MAG: hypothetical protein LBQ61_04740 [Spirochaetales bacterium]|jgi:hypothetical protein|nr:hypothetical protein [Spirochaetales bacterium]
MKKLIMVLTIFALVSGALFADQGVPEATADNAVYVDLGPTFIALIGGGFGLGLGYERAINPYWSLFGIVDYAGGTIRGTTSDTYNYLQLKVGGKFYFLGTAVEGVHLMAQYQFTYGEILGLDGAFHNLMGTLGYKWTTGNLFFEMGVGYIHFFGESKKGNPLRSGMCLPISIGFCW